MPAAKIRAATRISHIVVSIESGKSLFLAKLRRTTTSTDRLDFSGTWIFTGAAMTHLSASQLRRAARIKHKIESLQKEFSRLLAGTAGAAAPRKRRKMSAAARRKIAAAARARWAKVKGRKTGAKPVKKAKRKMSASARKKLAALAKTRWKKAKAAGKSKL